MASLSKPLLLHLTYILPTEPLLVTYVMYVSPFLRPGASSAVPSAAVHTSMTFANVLERLEMMVLMNMPINHDSSFGCAVQASTAV